VNLAADIRRLIDGYRLSQSLYVAATLGIADLIASGCGTNEELAKATRTHAPSLYRLLRALASAGVLHELQGSRFELTPLGETLRSDNLDSVAGWAAYIGRPYHWQAWGGLLHSVRTGESAFQHVHGTDVWTYRSTRPEEGEIFDRAMMSLSHRSNAAILKAYDFGRFQMLADVGGGTGALLAAVLRAHPRLHGVLFDQPHVVAAAPSLLDAANVADRCRVMGGSFFETVPDACDAYMLRTVIHDWDEADSSRILAVIRRTIRADGTLLLIERVIDAPNEGREGKFSDLNMLVVLGGRERTREEFTTLLGASGFRLSGITSAGVYSIIEAVPT
jgi:hypothetical protein